MTTELTAILWMLSPSLLALYFPIRSVVKNWPRPKCEECGKPLRPWGRSRMCPSRHLKCQEAVVARLLADDRIRPSVQRMMLEWQEFNRLPGEYAIVQPERGEPFVWVE